MSTTVSSNLGVPTYVTATGYSCITSGAAELFGVLCHGTGTASYALYSSNTATSSTAVTGQVTVYATVAGATANSAVLHNLSIAFPTGFCFRVGPSADPKITLFWRPMGPAAS